LGSVLGELAALATSVLFSATSTQLTLAGRQVGSMVVNRLRLLLATLFLIGTHFLLKLPLPWLAGSQRWFWLGLSGIVGLVVGDALLFEAFIRVGPRLSMLMMSLAPILSTLLAWLFLGERLSTLQLLAIFITVFGIAWVVQDGNEQAKEDGADRRMALSGLLLGIGAAAGQAVGLVLAKEGLAGDFSPLSGTFMRMLAAATVLWAVTLLRGQASTTLRKLSSRPGAALWILGGSFTGPFLGVTLSLVAVQRTEVGIASTLMALPPVILLPVGYFVFKERFGWPAILGTLVALAGVGMLFLA
jgi:drug/metabolite transporter (DMT)-like permease